MFSHCRKLSKAYKTDFKVCCLKNGGMGKIPFGAAPHPPGGGDGGNRRIPFGEPWLGFPMTARRAVIGFIKKCGASNTAL